MLCKASIPLEKVIAQADIRLKDLWQGEEETRWYKGEKMVEFHVSLKAIDFGKRSFFIL